MICAISRYRLKVELLFFGSLVGCFRAMWLGFVHVMHILLHNCKNIEEHTKTSHGVNYESLEKLVQELQQAIAARNVNPVEELAEKVADPASKKLVQAMLRAVRQEYQAEFPLYGNAGVYYYLLIGSQLPVNGRDKPARVSTFTKKAIKGLSFLVDSGNNAITIEEALEWAFVNKFTPYNTGTIINPF